MTDRLVEVFYCDNCGGKCWIAQQSASDYVFCGKDCYEGFLWVHQDYISPDDTVFIKDE